MSHHLRLRGSLLTVSVMMLALLPAVTATATSGVMYVTADTTLTEDHNGPIEITADNVTLDCAGYKVTGTGSGIGIEANNRIGVTIGNCHVTGFEKGISLANTQNSVIDGNKLVGNSGPGVFLIDSSQVTISGNQSESNGLHGIALYESNMLTVTGNIVSDNGTGGIDGYGMKIRLTDDSSFTHNHATGNLVSGFVTDGIGNTFTDNEASGNGSSGFIADGANGNSFVGNVATGNTASGFGVFNGGPNSVTNNDAHQNGEWGFESADNSGDVTFSENRCIDNVIDGSNPPGLCDESGHFTDDDGTTFELDIEWMAREGITLGCNPPTNDLFCPDSSVSRGQMAAFLTRALELPPAPTAGFVDTVGSTFESDIDRLAVAGITRGCNPPTNTMFCTNDNVTRGQMAAFLVRALGYTDDGGGNLFVDDDGLIFETDIDKLATAGVTRGCNPPTNDQFCPTSNVTRGQMAAFLHRALG